MIQAAAPVELLRARLDALWSEFAGIDAGNVEAVHRARVAIRRLRELLPLLQHEGDATHPLDRTLRKLAKRLGTVRDLDAIHLLIIELEKDDRYPAVALDRVSVATTDARKAAHEHLAARFSTAEQNKLTNRLERALERSRDRQPKARRNEAKPPMRSWLWALEARTARRAADLRTAIEKAGTVYRAHHLHNVRVAVKKLRYTTELLVDVGRRRLVSDIAILTTNQDLLGRVHDMEVLLAWGRELQASLLPPNLGLWRDLGSFTHAIEDDCRVLHARFVRDRQRLVTSANRLGAGRALASSDREATG
jgi:CHAD domain-containing protein